MKIAIAVDAFHGGAGNVAQLLALNYAEKGADVYLIITHEFDTRERYPLGNINVIELNVDDSNNKLVPKVLKFKETFKLIEPDVIISFLYTISIPVLISQIFNKIPIIASERSNPYQNIVRIKDKILRKVSYVRADAITVQFVEFKKFDNSASRKNKVSVIPNMILSSSFKKNYNKKSEKISFVTFATLYHVKRLDLMIRLFARIHEKCPNTELNIYGKGEDKEYLEDLINALHLEKAVSLKGHVNNNHECLSLNDVYLMTSEREGFPNALSEAMAVGLPSISFKCHEGLAQLVDNAVNGFLIEEGDHNGFCEKAENLVLNFKERKKLGEAALIKTKEFSTNIVLKMWDNILDRIVN